MKPESGKSPLVTVLAAQGQETLFENPLRNLRSRGVRYWLVHLDDLPRPRNAGGR